MRLGERTMNEESGAVRDASELERKVSEAAFIIASKNLTAMARTGRHTYTPHTRSIGRLAGWLHGRLSGWIDSRADAHLHKTIIRIWTDYRSASRSVGLRARGGRDGRRDFIRAKRPCGRCGGRREAGKRAWQVI